MRERLQRARDAEHAAFVEKTQGQLQESMDRAVHSSQAKISVDVVGRGSEGGAACGPMVTTLHTHAVCRIRGGSSHLTVASQSRS